MKKSYHLCALGTVTFWAASYVFTRIALRHFSPPALGALRYIVASLVLAVVLIVKKVKLPARKDVPLLVLSGGLGFFLYMAAFNTGSQTVTAATGCTVIATVPVITALLAQFVYKEKLRAVQYAGMAVSFAGVVILTLMEGEFSANTGLFYMFAAAVCLSVYNLLQRKLTKRGPPLQTTAFSIFFGTAMLAAFAPTAGVELASADKTALLSVLALGVFPGAVAYCLWAKALSMAENTSSVTNYMFIEPFITAILGFLLAGEKITAPTVIGGSVILLGLAVFYFGEKLVKPRAAVK